MHTAQIKQILSLYSVCQAEAYKDSALQKAIKKQRHKGNRGAGCRLEVFVAATWVPSVPRRSNKKH